MNTGDELKANGKFMSGHRDLHPETLWESMFKGMHFMLNFKVFMSKILQEEFTRRGGLGFCEKYCNTAL